METLPPSAEYHLDVIRKLGWVVMCAQICGHSSTHLLAGIEFIGHASLTLRACLLGMTRIYRICLRICDVRIITLAQ